MKTTIRTLKKIISETVTREKAALLRRDARELARSAWIDNNRSPALAKNKRLRASKLYAKASTMYAELGDAEKSQECSYEAESLAKDASR